MLKKSKMFTVPMDQASDAKKRLNRFHEEKKSKLNDLAHGDAVQ
jgi:hypothetical protein